jgi:hypothetical protein
MKAKSPSKQNQLGWGTLRMVAWATRPVTLWNTVYLERAKSRSFDPAPLRRVSPLGWGHINLMGGHYDYT